jgi:hypothetical protein
MPMPPKLHLNEHLSPRLAAQLRKHGFDVTSTLELGMVEADDDEQLAFAASQQRALVTFNHQHLAPLHKQYVEQGKEHWGIILSTEESLSILSRRLFRWLNESR